MAYRSALLSCEPNWQPESISIIKHAPLQVRNWLRESGSLTRRLKLLCEGQFNVSLQYQRWTRPTLCEQKLLGIRHGDYANIREVMLRKQEDVFVIARTVIPRQMLVGRQRHLVRLGNKPLGEVIFAVPGLQRSRFEIAVIGSGSFRHQIMRQEHREMIWGRRSRYLIHGKPILISEIFLPALLHYEASKA